jgi:hypothetical protein
MVVEKEEWCVTVFKGTTHFIIWSGRGAGRTGDTDAGLSCGRVQIESGRRRT